MTRKTVFLVFCILLTIATSAYGQELRDPLALKIVHVSDLDRMDEHDGRGGLAKLATLVGELRIEGRPRLVTHGGGAISPSVLSSYDPGRHMIALLNRLPLDLLVLGNHEFDFGPDVLQRRLQESEFAVLAANLLTDEGRHFPG